MCAIEFFWWVVDFNWPILTFASDGWHYCGRKCWPDPEHLISYVFLLVGRFTLQYIFCPFWHFSPYCRIAWCHIFAGDTFNFYLFIFQCGVQQSLSRHSEFSTSHGSFHVLCLFCLSFCVQMLCGVSCTGGLWHFSCGVNVIVTNFVGEWIMVCWKLILSAWHPIRWLPMFRYSLYMLSFTIRRKNIWNQWYFSNFKKHTKCCVCTIKTIVS